MLQQYNKMAVTVSTVRVTIPITESLSRRTNQNVDIIAHVKFEEAMLLHKRQLFCMCGQDSCTGPQNTGVKAPEDSPGQAARVRDKLICERMRHVTAFGRDHGGVVWNL